MSFFVWESRRRAAEVDADCGRKTKTKAAIRRSSWVRAFVPAHRLFATEFAIDVHSRFGFHEESTEVSPSRRSPPGVQGCHPATNAGSMETPFFQHGIDCDFQGTRNLCGFPHHQFRTREERVFHKSCTPFQRNGRRVICRFNINNRRRSLVIGPPGSNASRRN